MQTIVKASDRADFLALVPQLVGFVPEDSLVLVAFRGTRTCGALRIDLPPREAASVHKRMANTLFGMLCRIPGADAVVPVVYTTDGSDKGQSPPRPALVGTLTKRAALSGFRVKDALFVARDGWGTYLDPGREGAHPLHEIATSPVLGQLPASERPSLVRPEVLARLLEPGFAERELVGAALRRLTRRQEADPDDDGGMPIGPVGLAEWSLDWPTDTPEPELVAALLLVVAAPANRDAITLQYAFGRQVGEKAFAVNAAFARAQRATGLSMDELVAAQMAASEGNSDSDTIGDLMMGRGDDRPSVERVERAIALLRMCTSLAPRRLRPAPLCMLAWLSWSLGRGSAAGLFLETALSIDPGYGMALVLTTMLGTGLLPDWAFHPPAAGRIHSGGSSQEDARRDAGLHPLHPDRLE